MYFEQFYLSCLAHASYMLGSEGVAAVVDPQRDVDIYLQAAASNGLKIAHVFETHLHADFLSGHCELAERTGAQLYISALAGAAYPHVGVKDGFELAVGKCRLRVLETPGHSPESICLAIYDPERETGAPAAPGAVGWETGPWAVLTGDTLFIGDVGRPDLSRTHSPEELAGLLYDSLHQKLLTLPNETLIYPAHGSGSLCGRAIGTTRFSTIGAEKLSNYALQIPSRHQFILAMTSHLPPRPQYFREEAALNRAGAAALSSLPDPPSLTPQQVLEFQRQGAFVLDTGPAGEYAAGHVPGSICIDLKGEFALWAGIVIGLHTPIVLVSASEDAMRQARMRLARVGIEDVRGWLAGGIDAWDEAGLPTEEIQQIGAAKLYQWLENDWVQVLDVRREPEWQAGHIAQAHLYPLDNFLSALPHLEDNPPTAIHCKGGFRSIMACGLLKRAGVKNIMNIVGGLEAWTEAKLPVVQEHVAM